MKEHIRSRLMKAVENYDRDKNSRSLMDFIQTNVRLCTVISNLQGGSEQPRRKLQFFLSETPNILTNFSTTVHKEPRVRLKFYELLSICLEVMQELKYRRFWWPSCSMQARHGVGLSSRRKGQSYS